MMIVTTDCVDCDRPCIYEACRFYRVTKYVCDECKEEAELYRCNDRELCKYCVLEDLEKVEESWN